MRAVIICGGTIRDYGYIREQIRDDDTVICADSGYNHAVKLGLTPSLLVGDFDSIGGLPAGVKTVSYPARKDLTDTEIALGHAREMGFTDFLLIAAIGSRLDHTLANIQLLQDCLERGENAQIMDEHNKICATASKVSLCEPPGSIVSLLPLSDCYGVATSNLEYPLRGEELFVGKRTRTGVSNIMLGDEAEVSVQSGTLLVIVARD